MHVVIVNDHLSPDGGADVVAFASARALAEAGAEVTLFAAEREPSRTTGSRPPYRVVSTSQDDLAHGPVLGAAWQGLWNRTAAKRLRELLADMDPLDTVVHVHSWTKALSSSIFSAVAEAGFAQLCTVHEYFSVCPGGLLFNSQTLQPCTLVPMSASCIITHCDTRSYPHKLYRVARHAVQMHSGLAQHVDRFITISRISQDLIASHLPPQTRFSLVPNPIEIGAYQQPADPGAANSFVMVARMFAAKGWELFLQACQQAGVPAVCVGEGPDRAALQARFPQAQFIGQLDRAGVVQAMRDSRALVLPSLWYETQGMVIAEAAAHGIPAIASDRCGGAEAIESGVNGLVFRGGDGEALTAAIAALAGDGNAARRMGAAAAQRFWANPPTAERHARELLKVYRETLAERAVRGRNVASAQPIPGAGA